MPRKELLFFSAIILMGFLDWLTTMTGILFRGAVEVNPLLSGLTKSSKILFSVIKLTAISLAGFGFYKAAVMVKSTTNGWHFTSTFLNGGCSMAVLMLALVVANNAIVVLRP